MNSLVRRSLIDSSFPVASQLFWEYVDGRTVTLLGIVPISGFEKKLGTSVRATLQRTEGARCSVHWEPAETALVPTEFRGMLWIEPDNADDRRSWLVLDGEYAWSAEDPLAAILIRRLSAAIARDLLARVGDFIEARHHTQVGPGYALASLG